MHALAIGTASLVALAIIGIGVGYLTRPRDMVRSFGLLQPEDGPNTAWWLRLKGVRDVASGLVVLVTLVWGGSRMVGLVLAAETLIPIGDMLVILAGRGSRQAAFGIHGATALVMMLTAASLLVGLA